jgi:hypothetical protein
MLLFTVTHKDDFDVMIINLCPYVAGRLLQGQTKLAVCQFALK